MAIEKIITLVGGNERTLGVIEFNKSGFPRNIKEILDDDSEARWTKCPKKRSKKRSGYAFLEKENTILYLNEKYWDEYWGVVRVEHFCREFRSKTYKHCFTISKSEYSIVESHNTCYRCAYSYNLDKDE